MKTAVTALVLSSFLAGAAFAECTRESAPNIPDGKNASEADLIAAQQAVKSYMASAEAYIACLQEEQKAAGEEEPAEAKAARLQSHNATADEMNVVATGFNEAIKAFKAAQ